MGGNDKKRQKREGEAISDYILHLPEDEGVLLSGPAAQRLIQCGDGDAALLYIAVLKNRGSGDDEKIRAQLGWDQTRFRRALDVLARQGLVSLPGQSGRSAVPPAPPTPKAEDRRPEYTRADMARALEGQEFAGLTGAVEEKLGKKLTTPDLAILLGLYDQLGLPADVVFLLVGFCAERTVERYGQGRKPTMRQIEKEGYTWARLGLMTQESAAAYIKKYQRSREALPRMMRLLRLGDRAPAPSEEKYLMAWSGMGFTDEAIELAYDKTVVKCKELKWPYMDRILKSWHEKGLHTLAQVQTGDRPARRQGGPAGERQETGEAAREDMARMEKYLRQLRREKEAE
ncbi:MAG: DnaD domain protein [Oscillospiraceae bacterium]|nr:DnaD domain protein [Oscillospiraceae bacterium]